jgi:Na+-transporting NADH:ubiquinone oxidoreductase subunit B
MALQVLSPVKAFPVTTGAPHVRSLWNGNLVTLAVIIALLPPFGEVLYRAGLALLPGLAVALAVALAFEALFARIRRRPFTAGGVVTAIAVMVMVPVGAPLWQVALGLAFGVVIGEQIFGGRGRNFVNPAAVALAFLMFSFPDNGYTKAAQLGWMSCLPGALVLIATGLASWRVIVAVLIGVLGAAYAVGGTFVPVDLLAGGFVFGLVFLACDPVTSAATNLGRWVYGLMIGVLVMVTGAGGPGAGDSVIFAILLSQIFAPLIDQGVIALNVYRRRRRYDTA